MSEFAGFPASTTRFMRDLADHNNKEWFDANRASYEDHWLEPAKAFVQTAGASLQSIAPVTIEPRVNGSILRINRDLRFTADKTPYKEHLDIWFWEGDRQKAVSRFYLRLTPTRLGIGAGALRFDPRQRAAFRAALTEPNARRSLVSVVRRLERAGHRVEGRQLTTIPRGLEVPGEVARRLVKHGSMWIGEEGRHPPELKSAALVPWAMDRWRAIAPLHRWLVRWLTER